jgi:preprotein translocase subunit SecG
MSHFWSDIFSILFAIASILLVFIVLLQRGRGGGLAGAFGATGGQSAFGTKAGDVFTRITIGVAFVWVALAGITGAAMTRESKGRFQSQAAQAPLEPELSPATPAEKAVGGGGVGDFEKGSQGASKASTATNAGTPTAGTTQPAPAKTSSPAPTPPAKSSSAPTTTKSSAPGK